MTPHLHWRFYAWNGTESDREIYHIVQVSVIGYNDESSAKEAVSKIIKREVYKLFSVYECNTCNYTQQQLDALKNISENL